jgi:hypothetical protein
MWWPFAFSQTRCGILCIFIYVKLDACIGLHWKGWPFHRGVPEAAAAAPQSAEAAAVPIVPAGCLSASVFRADLPLLNSVYPCIRPDETFDDERPPRNTSIGPGCQTGVPVKLRFALGNIYRAKSWTMRSVADAKWSATRNSWVASCYQPSSCLVDDNFHLGSVSSAVKCRGDPRLPIAVCGHAASGRSDHFRCGRRRDGFLRSANQDRSALPAYNAVPNRCDHRLRTPFATAVQRNRLAAVSSRFTRTRPPSSGL